MNTQHDATRKYGEYSGISNVDILCCWCANRVSPFDEAMYCKRKRQHKIGSQTGIYITGGQGLETIFSIYAKNWFFSPQLLINTCRIVNINIPSSILILKTHRWFDQDVSNTYHVPTERHWSRWCRPEDPMQDQAKEETDVELVEFDKWVVVFEIRRGRGRRR